ncbi:helix-turn-helix domain-containing protein [Morganella sp. EGD-HP17]|uniref:helix-turn-helix domain-containing protein n=1 Tax=Morganella sp. EGD-HP17 TaxID=1435146 RepID=UPI00209FF708|nr:helix-turn-helix transcriptional regulator [Morganella sp. EGD-HP17]
MRYNNCLTTRQLAYSVGISQQQMSRYERGVNRIHVDILYRLSLVFRCGVNDFFSDMPSPAGTAYYDEYGGQISAVITATTQNDVR